jgi:hypothetical protein
LIQRLANGRYQLADKLGSGGMATVYKAWDDRLRVWRAAKVLAGASPQVRARFEREARAMARLHHPGVLAVHDVGEDELGPWLVMDLAAGGSLADVVARHGPLPPRRAVAMVRDVLAALQAAHDAGIIHRDVKPQNVLLDASGRPLLADFGIARLDDASLTATRASMGTLAYMAPEQRTSAARVDGRADVYAAAGTLVALLTGREPADLFLDRDETWAGVPAAVIPALRRASRYDVHERFATANEFADALGAVELEATEADGRPLALEPIGTTLDEPPEGSGTWTDDPAPPEPPSVPSPSVPAVAPWRPWRWAVGFGLTGSAAVVIALPWVFPADPGHPSAGRAEAGYVETRVTRLDPEIDPVMAIEISGDGSTVWYVSRSGLWREPADGSGAPVAVLTDMANGSPDVLTDGGDGVYLYEWAVDRVAYRHVDADGTVSARAQGWPSRDGRRRLTLEGGAHVERSDRPDEPIAIDLSWRYVIAAAWSPDGRRFALADQSAGPVRLRVLDTDTGAVTPVLADDRLLEGGVWNTADIAWLDDRTLVVPLADGPDTVLTAVDLDGGVQRPLHRVAGGRVRSLSVWNGRIAFVRTLSNEELWRGTLGPDGVTGAERVTRRAGQDRLGYLAADGTLLMSHATDAVQITARRADGSDVGIVPADGADWTPVGDYVAGRKDGTGRRLVQLDGRGGAEPIVDLASNTLVSCTSGRCLLSDGTATLRWVDTATGATTVAAAGVASRADLRMMAVSHDGTRVARVAAAGGAPVIDVLDLATGASVLLSVPLDDLDIPVWTADDQAVLSLGYDAERYRMYESAADGSRTALVYETDSVLFSGDVAPDGRTIYWSEDPMAGEGFILDPR